MRFHIKPFFTMKANVTVDTYEAEGVVINIVPQLHGNREIHGKS